jgi:large subunit ribosomal protein L4
MEANTLKAGKVASAEFETDFLGTQVRGRLLRHAVQMYECNQRSGTHKTKSRGELSFRKSALFRQKGSGRARVRHPQATQCRSGGVPHGPKPRDYSYTMPRRALQEAKLSALLSKFRDGEVTVADTVSMAAARTRDLANTLKTLGYEKSCLIVNHERSEGLERSSNNLRRIEVVQVSEVNAYNLLFYKNLIITEEALNELRPDSDDGDDS